MTRRAGIGPRGTDRQLPDPMYDAPTPRRGVIRPVTPTPQLPSERRRHRSLRWQRMTAMRRAYGATLVWLRWPIVLVWAVATIACAVFLPALGESQSGGFGGFTQSNSKAIQTEVSATRTFDFPLISRLLVVQHDPHGLTPDVQKATVKAALDVDQHPAPPYDKMKAIPLVNHPPLGGGNPGTTAVTMLGFDPSVPFDVQVQTAQQYAQQRLNMPNGHVIGVTGLFAGRYEQLHYINSRLVLLEIVTVLAVLLIVGLRFRSVVAPLVTAIAAGVSYVLVIHLAPYLSQRTGTAIPSDLEPLLVALLLGVATDYSIFYLAGMEDRLGHGDDRLTGARIATAEYTPIVLTAGLTVAATVLALLVAKLGLFRSFGPGMAVTVAVVVVVSVTLVPALLAIFGRAAFWPSKPRATTPRELESGEAAQSLRMRDLNWSARFARSLTIKPVALLVVVVCLGGAAIAAYPLRHIHLDLGVTGSLPHDDEVQRAARALDGNFGEGLLSPTIVLLRGGGVAKSVDQLSKLEDEIAHQPGVSAVLGPREQPLVDSVRPGTAAFVAPDADAARIAVVFTDEPTTYPAIHSLERLQSAMPHLLANSGVSPATVAYGGDTALSKEAVTATTSSLGRIALAAFVVDFVLLAIFLRALVAPAYLLLTNAVALVSALGITTWVFQSRLGYDGIVFYAPFAAFVLLLALGSDYNIFGVGSVWDEARHRPLRDAITLAVPRTTGAITAAGIALALSFGLLVLVPLSSFAQLACVMFAGIVIDAFVVRSLLVPALLTLFGRASGWPGRQLRDPDAEIAPAALPTS